MATGSQGSAAATRIIAELFHGRDPKLDLVPLGAPWRPFAVREDRRRTDSRPR